MRADEDGQSSAQLRGTVQGTTCPSLGEKAVMIPMSRVRGASYFQIGEDNWGLFYIEFTS